MKGAQENLRAGLWKLLVPWIDDYCGSLFPLTAIAVPATTAQTTPIMELGPPYSLRYPTVVWSIFFTVGALSWIVECIGKAGKCADSGSEREDECHCRDKSIIRGH